MHEELLGLDDAQKSEIESMLFSIATEAVNQLIPTQTFERVLIQFESELPALANSLVWTKELLKVFANRHDGIMAFASAFMLSDNDLDIEDYDDLVGYIIARGFQGTSVTIKRLEKLLRSHGLLSPWQALTSREFGAFNEGSSIEYDNNGQAVHLSRIGRKRYLRYD